MNKKQHKHAKSKAHQHIATGTLDITRSGIGYVIVEGQEKDIFVRPQHFHQALNGDRVSVKINRHGRSGRMEGEIVQVLERKQSEFIGRIEINKNFAFFIPDKSKGTPDMYIPGDKINGAKNNDRVVVKITEWNKKNPEGEVVAILNASDENDLAMKEILVDAGFALAFDDDALEEAARIPDTISAAEISKRKDFREILTFTIDPEDAKEYMTG